MGNTRDIIIPDTVGAAGLISHNVVRRGSRYDVDGFVYDLETGERIGKYFRGAIGYSHKRIWAGYSTAHLPELEARMFRVWRRMEDFLGKASSEMFSLADRRGTRPCTTPDEDGRFRRFSVSEGKFLWFDWCETGKGQVARRTEDGDRIDHLEDMCDTVRHRYLLFESEVDSLIQRLCCDRFGLETPITLTRIVINGREYLYQLRHTGMSSWWYKLHWGCDDINEFSMGHREETNQR